MPQGFISRSEGTISRAHEDPPLEDEHGYFCFGRQRIDAHSHARGKRGEIVRPQEARLSLNIGDYLLAFPYMVSHGNHVSAGSEYLGRILRREAGAPGCVFGLGYAEVHSVLLPKGRQELGQDIPSGASDDVSYDKCPEAHRLPFLRPPLLSL